MNDDIEDMEDLVKEEEPEPQTDRSHLFLSKVAYNLAIVLLDAGTSYLIAVLTYWFYGIVWFLAGAVVFFMHQKNFFTAGINEKQEKGAQSGIIVSVVSVIAMAIISGALFILRMANSWVEIGLIAVSISLYSWHAFKLAMHVFNDDGFRIENTVARAFATAKKKKRIAKASGSVAKAYREASNERENQYRKHGKGNIDAAIGKMEGRQRQPVYASDEKAAQEDLPTNGQERK
jgi:hypothetical protein